MLLHAVACHLRAISLACVALAASIGVQALQHSTSGLVNQAQNGFIVRYAFLNPSHKASSLGLQLSLIERSLCHVEQHLTVGLNAVALPPPWYLVYTDNSTDASLHQLLAGSPNADVVRRVSVVNLDTEPDDLQRMAPFTGLGLDPTNLASVRRTLADDALLPVDRGRLLLGTDVVFLRRPDEFLQRATRLLPHQALYMADGATWGGKLYTMAGYAGPQCPGLMADFVFLSPNTRVNASILRAKMLWYRDSIAHGSPGTQPECLSCAGLHAIDQFGLMLALGEAVVPQGNAGGCSPLSLELHQHVPSGLKSPGPLVQIAHGKLHSNGMTCSAFSGYEQAFMQRFMWFGIELAALTAALLFVRFIAAAGVESLPKKGFCASVAM